MQSREDLERRVAELEKQVAGLAPAYRGIRKQADWGLGDVPFYSIALGPDPSRGELRGHAKGIIAIGDIATGVLALGGFARGLIAIGGASLGAVSLGGLSLGVLVALGGLAIGGVALGGAAVGGVAVGGGAFGHYACGGGAAGAHAVSALSRDPEGALFFERYGLESVCGTIPARRR
jgi:hypothetical protein